MSLDSYSELCASLGLVPSSLPHTPEWSAAADFLQLVTAHVLQKKPQILLECGSGLSTLILARCCAINGSGQVFSLENGADYATATRKAIRAHGLENFSTVLDAPLIEYTLGEQAYSWYDLQALECGPVELLIVDGPPGFLQEQARYPALPLLHDRLAGDCTIYLDDAARTDEQALLKRWRDAWPDIPCRYIANERGCAILGKGAG